MKGFRTTIWVAAALAIALSACAKKETPKPMAAAPAAKSQAMPASGTTATPAAPAGQKSDSGY